MVKRVVDKRMVAHLWANQSQTDARTGTGSFSFKGTSLYSYGTEIGLLATRADGGKYALLVDRKYSQTTSIHLAEAARAVNYRYFNVPNLEDDIVAHAINLTHFVGIARAALREFAACRMGSHVANIYEHDLIRTRGPAYQAVQQVTNYANAFGLRAIDFTAEIETAFTVFNRRLAEYNASPVVVARAERRATQQAALTAQLEIVAAEHAEHQAGLRVRWLAGENVTFRGTTSNGGAYLRVKGNVLQTSLGATVPLPDAIKAFRMVQLVMQRGTAWHRNGEVLPVGKFQVDHITPDGTMHAGCHLMTWPEIQAAAIAAGVGS